MTSRRAACQRRRHCRAIDARHARRALAPPEQTQSERRTRPTTVVSVSVVVVVVFVVAVAVAAEVVALVALL